MGSIYIILLSIFFLKFADMINGKTTNRIATKGLFVFIAIICLFGSMILRLLEVSII